MADTRLVKITRNGKPHESQTTRKTTEKYRDSWTSASREQRSPDRTGTHFALLKKKLYNVPPFANNNIMFWA